MTILSFKLKWCIKTYGPFGVKNSSSRTFKSEYFLVSICSLDCQIIFVWEKKKAWVVKWFDRSSHSNAKYISVLVQIHLNTIYAVIFISTLTNLALFQNPNPFFWSSHTLGTKNAIVGDGESRSMFQLIELQISHKTYWYILKTPTEVRIEWPHNQTRQNT